MVKKHFNITIYGLVQGVSFRWEAIKIAKSLDLNGFVKNKENGSVYIEAEAEPNALKEFTEWCELGPVYAEVDEIVVEEDEMQYYDNFEVRY